MTSVVARPLHGSVGLPPAAMDTLLQAQAIELNARRRQPDGARVFEKAACSACHTPVMFTGTHEATAPSQRPAPLYSDLLLHDGRAKSVTEAVSQHDGAAAASRRKFEALPAHEQRQLLEFLKTV
jgi:CxxC motif-containing protein (DUF1111 family)